MKYTANLIYKDVPIEISYEISKGYPATYETPEEPAKCEITSVQVENTEISTLLNDEDFNAIEQLLINDYEE